MNRLDAATRDLDRRSPSSSWMRCAPLQTTWCAGRAASPIGGQQSGALAGRSCAPSWISPASTAPGYTLARRCGWADEFDDIVIAYPTVERSAYGSSRPIPRRPARHPHDHSVEQLNFVGDVVPAERLPLRVCLDLDASLRPRGRVHLGPRRSAGARSGPAAALARHVADRSGFGWSG